MELLMDRRDFLKASAAVAAGAALGAAPEVLTPEAPTVPKTPPLEDLGDHDCTQYTTGSSFCRPQTTAEDLVAEYRAWVGGDLDGHDQTVVISKQLMWDPDTDMPVGQYANPDPTVEGHDGFCETCSSPAHSVREQLRRELVISRARRQEWEAREKLLAEKMERWV